MNGIEKLGSLTQSSFMIDAAKKQNESNKFSELIERAKEKEAHEKNYSHISSEQVLKDGRLNGDISTGYNGAFTSNADKNAKPQGAAVNSSKVNSKNNTIDKTSRLYEKSLELEGFFVKMMLSSMRKTISSNSKNSFAKNMYEDMLYDEYATALTKNAGFGIADQIYLQLNQESKE